MRERIDSSSFPDRIRRLFAEEFVEYDTLYVYVEREKIVRSSY